MKTANDSPLGRNSSGSEHYDPGLLFPIARAPKRAELGVPGVVPFRGVDIWNAYELSWLDVKGKPCIAIGEFRIAADSANLIESKSLKLYLNSFNQTRFDDIADVRALLARDLARACGGEVGISLRSGTDSSATRIEAFAGESIDGLDVTIDCYGPPQAGLLCNAGGAAVIDECLVSHLFKSNCPVTAQPDWASVQVAYRGVPIDRAGLLRYLVSFRHHDDFHEHCVERIFVDILQRCAPQQLTVHARYTRRGGLDINPWRSNSPPGTPSNPRLPRQ